MFFFVCSLFLLDVFIDLLVPPAEASSLATSSWVFSPPSVMRVIPWGLGNAGDTESSNVRHGRRNPWYFSLFRKSCEDLPNTTLSKYRLLWAPKVQVILQQTWLFVDSDDCLPNALHPSWTDYRLLFAKSASPHHGFAAFYTYLEFIFKVPQFFSFNWLWAQHLAQDV